MAFIRTLSLPLAPGALALGALLAVAAPANAQMYPGADVTVNPGALGAPGPAYRGGLLPPGAKSRNLPPVHLHMPATHHRRRHHHHHVARRKPKHVARHKTEDETQTAKAEPAPAPAEKPGPPPASTTDNTAPAAIPFSLGPPSAAPAEKPAPPKHKTLAATAPMPKITLTKGLSKQAAVLFDSGSSDLSDNSTARLNDLAFSLKTALTNGADHVELVAYGGAPGDKSSAARRLSLKRALAVRQALIVDGVPADRIDVRALGGVTDNGATDRVDIFVKS